MAQQHDVAYEVGCEVQLHWELALIRHERVALVQP